MASERAMEMAMMVETARSIEIQGAVEMARAIEMEVAMEIARAKEMVWEIAAAMASVKEVVWNTTVFNALITLGVKSWAFHLRCTSQCLAKDMGIALKHADFAGNREKTKNADETVRYFHDQMGTSLTKTEEAEIREWYEKSDYQALSQAIAQSKSFKPMSDEEVIADLHKEAKSFIATCEAAKSTHSHKP